MKKLISALAALTLVLGLTACGDTSAPAETTQPAPEAVSALTVLENTWSAYAEEEKFAIIGGSMSAPKDNAPGSYPLTEEAISYNLLIPADQLASVTEAASMIHMMNPNTFTGAAFTLAENVTAADFSAVMKDAIANNQWICGFPEQLLIANLGDSSVVVAFGAADLVSVFQTRLLEANAGFQVMVNEAIF